MRLWNSDLSSIKGSLVAEVPEDIRELLRHLARGYLPYLNANVDAIRSGASRFTTTVDGVAPNIVSGVSKNCGSIIDVRRRSGQRDRRV